MHLTHQPRRTTRRVRATAVVVLAAFGLIGASCTNPAPAGGFSLKLRATQVTNVSFKGDWPLTFWDNDVDEEPYLVHLGLRIGLNPIAVTTSVASTYLNGGQYIGKIGAGQTIAGNPNDGLNWNGVQLPDVADLANGAPLEILGTVEFLFDRDQLVPLGIAQVLQGVSQVINAALPPILANSGIPSTPQGILDLLGAVLPGAFATIVGAVQAVVGNLTGGDTFIGFQPVMFVAAGGGLGDFLNGALPSVMNLVNTVLKAMPDTPLPNGLPLSLGVARHGLNITFGDKTATSVYKVRYGWV